MRIASLSLTCVLVSGSIAVAQPGATEPVPTTDSGDVETTAILPPSEVEPYRPAPVVRRAARKPSAFATTERWGGGVRLTGVSGIGALPGVNYGAEVAGLVRRDELFVELALARWRPEDVAYVRSVEHTKLQLDMWTVRAGWASMNVPIRIWGLVEVGEIAGSPQMGAMSGVIPRMVMGDTPDNRRWQALGAGMGVGWPMTQQAKLVGAVEFAVPTNRETLMLDNGVYQPDPMVARYSVGLEVGWR